MLKKFISYYKPHKKLFFLDMSASLFISVIGMLYPIITRKMLNEWIPNQNIRYIVLFGSLLLFLYFIRMCLRYFVQYYGHVMGVKIQAQMRSDLFNHLQKLPYSYYDEQETGKIMSRMTNDLMDVSELAHHGPENFFICGIMVIGSFCYLASINVLLTLIIFACIPLLVIITLIMRKRMNLAFMESRKAVAEINASLESSISGIRVTKAFTNSKEESKKFEAGNSLYVKFRSIAYKAMGQFHSSTSFVTDIFNVVVLIAGGIFLYNGIINYGDYSTFIVSVNLFISPVTTLINFVEQYQNASTGFERFLEIMEQPIEETNPDAKEIQGFEGEIIFDHVNFHYNEEKEVLKDICLKIKKGQTLALVGPSGGGKTTICHLIPNFYHVSNGSIQIDGTDINDITFESLRKNIGIVQQDVFLFNGTMKENILYGKLDATDEEIIEAAKRANIHDYILTLPNGYDTQIGERGVKLSGGQKQRLSIARVFLKNPSILILDEATSALDNTTEILIQQALDELCKGRTTIVVAHRLSTIKNADEIVVIANGEIKEKGSHDELLEKEDGIYKNLYSLQFRDKDSDSNVIFNHDLMNS
ncbi:ABC transporter ATP-binding protein [Faecalibaculum rodentium]|uniref:ABC transporter ATP-binding protein n=1 Tax=Faecalibaculum rodentium TaxID=1702221 RepID=UPI00259D30FF|nr:ABC transporter ATP-binding protein [Faecalibaculum rodentium]